MERASQIKSELNRVSVALWRLSSYYHKNAAGEEVDFVVKRSTSVVGLIQVSYDIATIETHKREVRALIKAGAELNCNDLLIINDHLDKTEEVTWFGQKGRIRYLPLYRWLIRTGHAS